MFRERRSIGPESADPVRTLTSVVEDIEPGDTGSPVIFLLMIRSVLLNNEIRSFLFYSFILSIGIPAASATPLP